MAYLGGRHGASLWASLGLAMVVGCTGDARDLPGAAGSSQGPRAPLAESPAARALVDAIRAQIGAAHAGVLAPSPGGVERRGEQLVPTFFRDPAPGSGPRIPRATVSLPGRASGPFQLSEVESGVAVTVTLASARDVAGEVASGLVVYRGGHASGADVVHRPTGDGTEDFLSFQRAPEEPEVRYRIALGDRVAGLRLVGLTLELLSADGAPRLRMAPPYLIDAHGDRRPAEVAVEGCAYDADPRPPWGRAVTAPGTRLCEVRVTWGSDVLYPALLDPAWNATGSMTAARQTHTGVGLGSGNFLVAGGSGPLATAELYNPATGTWAATGSMAAARGGHTATVLASGKVLVAGGTGAVVLASAELYDPTAGTWSSAGNMPAARSGHTATLLGSGTVLVAGGAGASTLQSSALYTPASNTWAAGPTMVSPRVGHTASLLGSGKVLAAAGNNGSGAISTAELYDPTANTWTATGALASARISHTATVLGSGLVLAAGGTFSGSLLSAELYNPATGTWSAAGNLNAARFSHTASLLGNGQVLVAGGSGGAVALNSTEAYSPVTNTWIPTGTMVTARQSHVAGVLAGGAVLVAGGLSTSSTVASAELFTLLGAGTACTVAGECASGFCVDGFCCNAACGGLCQACAAAKTGGANGTCASIPTGTDPDNECATEAPSTCQQDGFCNGAGACRLYASGTSCVAASCGNGSQTSPTCNGSGVCQPNTVNCAPYICGSATACATSCANDAQCVPSYHCRTSDGTCQLNLSDGLTCTAATQCASGNCVDGVCCDSPCTGLCQACSAAKTGAAAGMCAPITVGTDPDNECTADPASTCQQDGFCNGAGACRLYGKGTVCGASAVCTGTVLSGEVCDGLGKCAGNPVGTDCAPYQCHPSGCASPCGTDLDCVLGWFCSAGACVTQTPDGAACTVGDQCQSGFCVEGLCCDTACDGVCQACTAANKATGADGACGDAKAGADPHLDCKEDTAASCKLDGTCDGSGACRNYPAGTVCGSPLCLDNTPTALTCNGNGACLAAASGPSCGAFVCAGAACSTTCAVNTDCAPGSWCNAGQCQVSTAQGAACASAAECATGFCADGFCCDTACVGQCEACDATGGVGTCVPVDGAPHGARPACSSGTAQDPCSAASCDGLDRTTCNGFVGSAVTCRTGSCADGTGVLPAICDGMGSCATEIDVPCEPFACGATACGTTCATDGDCAASYRCENGDCVHGATCDGHHTVHTGDGQLVDCGAYNCQGDGTCRTECGSVDDCVAPNICLFDSSSGAAGDGGLAGGQCVPPMTVVTFDTIHRAISCSLTGSPGAAPRPWLLVLFGAALFGARSRRRRRDAPEQPAAASQRTAGLASMALLTLSALSAPSCSGGGDERQGPAEARGPGAATVAESAGARRVVEALGGRFGAGVPALAAPASAPADRFERAEGGLHPHFPAALGDAAPPLRPITVTLPARAGGAFQLTEATSGVTALVTLEGTRDVAGEVTGGLVVYRGGLAGADIVHRPSAEGTEDYLSFERAPAAPELRYVIALGERVAGLRLIAGALELVDAGGVPRLRMAPPYVIDAGGARHDAAVAVSGCAFDTDPRGPWGRSPTAPGARRCTVRVAWDADVRYPALVDPAWTAATNMLVPRGAHASSTLASGQLLVTGGQNSSGTTKFVELYDPASGTWTATASMVGARSSHTSTVLASGLSLVAGGQSGGVNLATCELYNPASGTWSAAGNLAAARQEYTATLLASGLVLAAGGSAATVLASTELYNPATNTWSAGGTMTDARTGHSATKLASGSILVAGGVDNSNYVATSELYNPATNTWSAGPSMAAIRWQHTATLLASNKVLVAGGSNNVYLTGAEIYDPTAGTWTATGSMANARDSHTASLVLGGKVLVAGGTNGTITLSSSELYDPTAGTWAAVANMITPRSNHTATVLASGQVLAAGGYYLAAPLAKAELFAFTAAGASCTQPGDCASGFCADGVCCSTACTGLCQACAASKTGGVNGTCAPITANTDPDSECTDLGAGSCATDGYCDGAGACQIYASGTVCVAPSCAAGVRTAPTCTGTGTCQPHTSNCAPYLCGDATSCATSCTLDAQCVPASYCRFSDNTCQPDQANGAACTAASQCQSGDCVDGFCCNAPCGGLCQACSAAKTGAANGTCAPITAGTDPDNECPADAITTCKRDGQCDGAGACRLYADTVSCGPTTCAANLVSGQVCDGLGTCALNNTGTDCSPYLCQAGGCTNPCGDSTQCQAGNYCAQGTCKPKGMPGLACAAGVECLSGFCVEGVCCNTACNGICQACTAANNGGTDGTCAAAKAGTDAHDDCQDQGGSSCQDDGFCDGSGACRKYPAGSTCAPTDCVANAPVASTCNGAGTCLPDPAPQSCGDFLCANGACDTTCATSADCAASAWCNAGACQPRVAQGQACTVGDGCTTGLCADGICCNAPCLGQCEACDVAGAAGTCLAVTGTPHGSRPACTPGTPDHPCLQETCDGTDRLTCGGFVDATFTCRPASCTAGVAIVAVSCDGHGHCPALGTDNSKDCSPFACADDACKTSCATDPDCGLGYRCEAPMCVPGACDGDHVVITGDQTIDCSPYKCTAGATCNASCQSVDDCASPNVCDQTGACVAPESDATVGGCSTAAPAREHGAAGRLCALGLAALVAARRRRGRRVATPEARA